MRRKFCGRKVESQVAAVGQTNIDGVRAQHCNAVTKQHCNNVTLPPNNVTLLYSNYYNTVTLQCNAARVNWTLLPSLFSVLQ